MQDTVMARVMFTAALSTLGDLMMHLTEDELDALIEEVTVLYEVYSDKVDMRMGDQSE